MSVSFKTHKMLWGRAAGRCSQCRMDLYEDETETDDPTLVGENCHIVAESDDGPRGDASMPVERRNSYANMILLCRNHHKVIDAQPREYTVEKLAKTKADHEAWVKTLLTVDNAKQFDDEQWAGIIDKWEMLAHINEWLGVSSYVLSQGQPEMRKEVDSDLRELRSWLLNRIWPARYPELRDAFHNFRHVLEDFHEIFRKHAEPVGDGSVLRTLKFYKIREWDEERYTRLANHFDFHTDLVCDLMLELTRAGNLICDRIREHLMRSYRLSAGHLVVQTGPTFKEFSFRDIVVQYSPEERQIQYSYPGLDDFFEGRKMRARHFGEGTPPE